MPHSAVRNHEPEALETLGARVQCELDRSAAVARVIGAMHERIDRPFALDEMARIAFLSRCYFNRVFREVTGLPPVRFHTALRMAAAKRLLVTTDLSVTEVCLEVGYQSLGTFITHFHELVGVSPRQLRRLATEPERTPAELTDVFTERRARTGSPAVEGDVLGAGDGWLVFVGLFPRPYPHGLPLACAVVRGSGPYRLHTGLTGRYHVAAAAFVSDGEEELAPTAVTSQPVRLAPGRTARRELRLRAFQPTDPPILLALPSARGLPDYDHGIDGHQPMPNAAGTLTTQ